MLRIGIDLGGTKIEVVALDSDGNEVFRKRIPTPREYVATVNALVALVTEVEDSLQQTATIGIGIPGVVSPFTGLVKNANSTWINGHPLDVDLGTRLNRKVKIANDANCFAVSEAVDGAAAGKSVVFGAIIGTGCGAGIAIKGQVHDGGNGIGGEWGHNPLPWMKPMNLIPRRVFVVIETVSKRLYLEQALFATFALRAVLLTAVLKLPK